MKYKYIYIYKYKYIQLNFHQGWEDFFRLKTNTDLIGAARVAHGAAVITKIIAGSFSEISF